jgi:tetratricopeptide (TPR) repeat protein
MATEPPSTLVPARLPGLLAPILCLLTVLAAYSNTPGNAFTLDDAHSIQGNPAVRSLSNIPRFFTDVSTFSPLKANQDYRPVLVTTYALDFVLSAKLYPEGEGYDTRPWHWTNLALHWVVAVSIFWIGRRLFGSLALTPLAGLSPAAGDWASLAAAVLFAVHPITTECCNYISARSSLLVGATALPAFVLYLGTVGVPGWSWRVIPAAILYALALFTKIEAISLMAVLVLTEMLLSPEARARPLLLRPFCVRCWIRLAPFVAITLIHLVIWRMVSPLENSAATRAGSITPLQYFSTQVTAWWYYLAQIVWPVGMVFDRTDYPLIQNLLDPRAAAALAAWLMVAFVLFRCIWTAPAVTLLGASYVLYMAPHSSIVPLAEMVNGHRPYVPVTGVFLLITIGAAMLALRWKVSPAALAAATVLLLIPLVALTRQRNAVFHDDYSLSEDSALKSPGSHRVQMQYGLALMHRARYKEAEEQFRKTIALAPYWHYGHTNLGIVLAAQGNIEGAIAAYDDAVRYAGSDASPYYWRGRFRITRGDLAGAAADLQEAANRSAAPYVELAALAECLLHMGRQAEADAAIARGRPMDPAGFDRERGNVKAQLFGGR